MSPLSHHRVFLVCIHIGYFIILRFYLISSRFVSIHSMSVIWCMMIQKKHNWVKENLKYDLLHAIPIFWCMYAIQRWSTYEYIRYNQKRICTAVHFKDCKDCLWYESVMHATQVFLLFIKRWELFWVEIDNYCAMLIGLRGLLEVTTRPIIVCNIETGNFIFK